LLIYELRGYSGRREQAELGVRHRQVQAATQVFNSVTGEVKEQQVFWLPELEESFHFLTHMLHGSIYYSLDLEITNFRIRQDAAQLSRITGRSSQLS
jgi:hypothetical protein